MLTGLQWAAGFLCAGLCLSAAASTAAEPSQAGPEVVLTLEPSADNPRNSEGAFVQLKDGRILFAYTHFTGGAADGDTAHIEGRYSRDGGRTWTLQGEVIVPNEGTMNTMSVSLLRLKSGAIALFYLRKESNSDCRLVVRFSTDETKSWSAPRFCMDTAAYYVVNNARVIQLASGRLVAPTAQHSVPGQNYVGRGDALCFLSDDDGKTWRPSKSSLSAPPDSRTGLQEPGVIELKDGRLMMLSRTDQGSQFRAYSKDGGDTWSQAVATDILSPVSPATVGRIPSTGDLLLVWNNHKDIAPALKTKRTPLTVALSHDEGGAWDHVKNIESNPDGWYCYTAMEFVGDHVLLAYCAGDSKVGGLNRTRILRVPVSWLYQE